MGTPIFRELICVKAADTAPGTHLAINNTSFLGNKLK